MSLGISPQPAQSKQASQEIQSFMSANAGTDSRASARSGGGAGWMRRIPLLGWMQDKWSTLATREKVLVATVLALALLSALWWGLLYPSWKLWKAGDVQQAKWEQSLQNIQAAGKRADALRTLPAMTTAEAKTALQNSLQTFGGAAQVNWVGNTQARIVLTNVKPDALAQWLTEARLNALSIPENSELTLSAAGWSGTIQMRLPVSE